MKLRSIPFAKIAPTLLAIIVDSMGFGLVYPILVITLSNPHTPLLPPNSSVSLMHFYLGLGFLLYPFCMFFGASILGDLSDMWGRKKVMMICMGGLCLSFLLMAFGIVASSLFFLMLGRALSGLMAGAQPIAQAAICDLSTEETKPKNMTLMTFTTSVGIVIGPLIGGLFSDPALVSFFNPSTPLFVAAFIAFIAFLWIAVSFEETFVQRAVKKISPLHHLVIFLEAFRHPRVRSLSLIFLLMQVGFSLYFQLILVLLDQIHHYKSWQLGIFNGFVGFSFGIGLLLIMRIALKYWEVEKVAIFSLFLTGVPQILSALFPNQIFLWTLALPIGAFDMVAYTALLTSYSNAAATEKQGWVLGISGSVMALSWTLSGLSTNLISYIGLQGLILIGGLLLILSAFFMRRYVKSIQTS
ncbi:MAG: MFS transporter [Anaerolineae bacterium]